MESMSLLYAFYSKPKLSDLPKEAKARTARPGKVTDSQNITTGAKEASPGCSALLCQI